MTNIRTISTATSAAVLAIVLAAMPAKPGLAEKADASQAAASSKPAEMKAAGLRAPSLESIPAARTFRDCSECPEMVEVPAGEFLMGSANGDPDEKPAHQVVISRAFAVGRFEVTFAEWEACAKDGGCMKNKTPSDEGWGRGRRPVINVSFNDVREYLGWLSAKTGKTYRLLSEAEWEYAARSGTTTRYSFGDSLVATQAKFSKGELGEGETAEVGSYAHNAFGLYDMHGNVWEWVEDCYLPHYIGAPADGSPRTELGCTSRVLRGGSWDYPASDLRSSVRYRLAPYYRVDEIGFRVARAID